ncbi:MAG: leukotoxin LktA family filamentous adhesin, partial [Gammaproteobacteria bacterium]|nr:leukotoxin LktA family filamentous adhesin [Gammaproteobacteria bacterium]
MPTEGNGWATSATTQGDVTEIRNARQIGANSYHSFEHFGVEALKTVNFRLDGAQNLVNLIRASRTDINGILNAFTDSGNTIGGNLFFVNPHGITIGAGGMVNVGSLSMVVPTQSAMDDYISALENVGSSVEDPLLFIGELQLAEDGSIDVQGTINADGGVLLLANTVNIGGSVTSRGFNSTATGAELFEAMVNVSGFQDQLGIFEVDGDIVIGAADSSGGFIDDLNPVKNTSAKITITHGANIHADGTIQISAAATQNPASVDNGLVEWNSTAATVDVDGAAITSDNAAVVLDAKASVELEVGGFDGLPLSVAIAKSDADSSVHVSGESAIEAATDVSIRSSSKTIISATANAESELATLTIAVANIDSDSSALVDGDASISANGAVDISSVSDTDVKVMADGLLSDGSGGGVAIAITDVDSSAKAGIGGAAEVLGSGSLSVTSAVANSVDTAARSVVTGDPQSLSAAVNDQENLGDNPNGEADGLKSNIDTALEGSFETEDDGKDSSAQLAAAFAYTSVDSSSVASIDSGNDVAASTVDSDGHIDVVAKSMSDASNLAQGKTAIGAAASITAGVSILHSTEVIGATVAPAAGELAVTADSMNVAAQNEDYSSPDNSVGDMASIAYAGSGGGGELGIAGAFAINLQDRDSVASIDGDGRLTIGVDGALKVTAGSAVSDVVVASATLSEEQTQAAEDKFAANSAAQQDPEPSDEEPEAGGAVGVGAAMAINVVTNTTDAHVGPGVTVDDSLATVAVAATSKADASVTAKAGSAADAEGSPQVAVGVGAAVAVSVVIDSTRAAIEANPLTVGTVTVNAAHQGAINVTSDGAAAGSKAAIGASIAISVSDTNTEAVLVSDATAGSVDLSASSNSSNTTVAKASASGAEQEDEAAEEPAEGEKAGVDKQAADLT